MQSSITRTRRARIRFSAVPEPHPIFVILRRGEFLLLPHAVVPHPYVPRFNSGRCTHCSRGPEHIVSSATRAPAELHHGPPHAVAVVEEPQSKTSILQTARILLVDTIAIFKLRVTALVVMTAWAGYYMGAMQSRVGSFNLTLWNTLVGVALVSCGASVLNQVFERRTDALMLRTAQRPLAAGRLGLGYGVLIGMGTIIAGSLWLMVRTNPITGTLTLLTAVMYVGIYTPLKRHTTLATFIGAFPGAMPPLIGWTAARGSIEWPAVALFAILFIWQFPHFMAIAWLYREDYGRAGIRMLPVVEPDGWSTAIEALVYAVLMIPVSLVPYYLHIAGPVYWVAAILLGAVYLAYTIRFTRITRCSPGESRKYARALLKVSVIYLPLLLAVLMLNARRS